MLQEEGGSRGLNLRTLQTRKAPPCPWMQQADPTVSPGLFPSLSLPAMVEGAPFSLVDPGGAKLVPDRNFLSGDSSCPTYPPPPNPWVQCLLSHSDASNDGASQGVPSAVGALGRVFPLLAALALPGCRGYQGPEGLPPALPLRVCPTLRM